MTTQYFTDSLFTPPALLRRKGFLDERFDGGVWRRTSSIIDWMAGENDFVEEISEPEARAFAPEAFAP